MDSPNLSQEFVRVNWVSQDAKNKWESIFKVCTEIFTVLEVEAVKKGLREATIQTCSPDILDQKIAALMKEDLVVIPIDKVNVANMYQSSGSELKTGEPWNFKVAIGKFEAVREIVYAYKNGDNETIGKVLGYPKCCINFFNHYWIKEQFIDTSLFMANGVQDHFNFSPYCNILLRWLGPRYVSHLPCNFNCAHTTVIGKLNRELAISLGYRTLADTLYNILSWPVEWSGLHGIGLVHTPVCRVTMRTDMWAEKQIDKLHSHAYPDNGAKGLTFPFLKEGQFSANGFNSIDSENGAHNLILDIVRNHPPKSVIDLGCGNSALLIKMNSEFGSDTFGVDLSAIKCPDLVADIFSLEDFQDDFDLALISKARIRENPLGWIKLLNIITKRCKRLLIYSYDRDLELPSVGVFKAFIGISDQSNVADLYVKIETA